MTLQPPAQGLKRRFRLSVLHASRRARGKNSLELGSSSSTSLYHSILSIMRGSPALPVFGGITKKVQHFVLVDVVQPLAYHFFDIAFIRSGAERTSRLK